MSSHPTCKIYYPQFTNEEIEAQFECPAQSTLLVNLGLDSNQSPSRLAAQSFKNHRMSHSNIIPEIYVEHDYSTKFPSKRKYNAEFVIQF